MFLAKDHRPSVSRIVSEKYDVNTERHFRWSSINKFIYLAYATAAPFYYFDMFSHFALGNVSFPLFVTIGVWPGMAYMFMDFFIKQYTRRVDGDLNLNPLLRGVSVGILLHTAFWSIIHARDLTDTLRFLMSSFKGVPSWAWCLKDINSTICYSAKDVIRRCRFRLPTDIKFTSAHIYYNKSFANFDMTTSSTRYFMIALVWIVNFFVSSIPSDRRLKLLKISFFFRLISTTLIVAITYKKLHELVILSFYELLDITSINYGHIFFSIITDLHGVGLIGVYDFDTMSPFTMIDNAIVIFTIFLIVAAFVRSMLVQVLLENLLKCVHNVNLRNHHYIFFVIMPLGIELMVMNKLYWLYVYLNLATATSTCLTMFTSTISRQLHNEFRSVQNIYIVGMLCCVGFVLTAIFNSVTFWSISYRLIYGLNICSLYLGGLKVIIVMWIYGVSQFCTDVQFWLGFKPTKCWRFLWVTLPFVLFTKLLLNIFIITFYLDEGDKGTTEVVIEILWIVIIFITVLIFHMKTIISFLFKNNLIGLFKSSPKYGPPFLFDRFRRKRYDEIMQYRVCHHSCLVCSENIECNHLPMTLTSHFKQQKHSNTIFASTSEKRNSSSSHISDE